MGEQLLTGAWGAQSSSTEKPAVCMMASLQLKRCSPFLVNFPQPKYLAPPGHHANAIRVCKIRIAALPPGLLKRQAPLSLFLSLSPPLYLSLNKLHTQKKKRKKIRIAYKCLGVADVSEGALMAPPFLLWRTINSRPSGGDLLQAGMADLVKMWLCCSGNSTSQHLCITMV